VPHGKIRAPIRESSVRGCEREKASGEDEVAVPLAAVAHDVVILRSCRPADGMALAMCATQPVVLVGIEDEEPCRINFGA